VEEQARRSGDAMQKGVIGRLAKYRGFGFIKVNGVQNLFFHRGDVRDAAFDLLREGQSVEFEVSIGPRGLRATGVKVIRRDFKNILEKETSVEISPERR
jgi:CspA family cold shock protein